MQAAARDKSEPLSKSGRTTPPTKSLGPPTPASFTGARLRITRMRRASDAAVLHRLFSDDQLHASVTQLARPRSRPRSAGTPRRKLAAVAKLACACGPPEIERIRASALLRRIWPAAARKAELSKRKRSLTSREANSLTGSRSNKLRSVPLHYTLALDRALRLLKCPPGGRMLRFQIRNPAARS